MKKQPYELYPETYIQLLEWIRAFAREHPGDRLPSEQSIAEQFGVSRAKIRDVLSQLEGAGYVTRKRGSGTLVNRYVLDEPARLDIDSIYVEIVAACGHRPRSALLSMKRLETVPREAAEKLMLAPGEPVYQLENMVYSDDRPVILVVDYIPARYYDSSDGELPLIESNIFLFLQQMCDELLETLIVHVDVCTAEDRLSELMEVEAGFPLLKLDSVCYTQASEPVLYSVEHYNTRLIPFSFQKRILSAKFKRSLPPASLRQPGPGGKETSMATVTWRTPERSGSVRVPCGTGLMEVLRGAGLSFPCGGNHKCGKCRVIASGRLSPPRAEEMRLLQHAPAGSRLACFVQVLGDCDIALPSQSGDRIETAFSAADYLPEPIYDGEYGAAFDIGTTTVVGYLFSRGGRQPLAVAGEMNRQSCYGADVLSRIEYASKHTVEPLRTQICMQLSDLLRTLCRKAGIRTAQISGLCVTGNTTMLHLAAGLDPYPLSQAPFTPQSLFGETIALPLPGFPAMPVYMPRCISAYVGADITCSILAGGIMHQTGKRLLVDVGTNGEMALVTGSGLYCCATAAGPAFEGAGISCGSSACSGAISRVTLAEDNSLHYTVIDGGEGRSLCGSGLIDAAACLLRCGIVDPKGRIQPDREGSVPLSGSVRLTQRDIRQLQLAKGAIRGGMDTLISAAGISYSQLDGIVLCGGFGSRLDPVSAEQIGLLPEGMAEKTSAIGNAAGAGAGMLLQSGSFHEEAARIAAKAQIVDLASSQFFQKRYIEAMNFPPLSETGRVYTRAGLQAAARSDD